MLQQSFTRALLNSKSNTVSLLSLREGSTEIGFDSRARSAIDLLLLLLSAPKGAMARTCGALLSKDAGAVLVVSIFWADAWGHRLCTLCGAL